MPVGVAIIGGGIFAREEHLPAVEACPDLILRAVYSRSLKSAQSLSTDASKVDLYSDDSGPGKGYEDLIQRDDIGAVIIVLPILTQPDFIKQALSAGKHVLSEKPIAGTIHETQSLITWYTADLPTHPSTSSNQAIKPLWSVAENYRFLHSLAHASKAVASIGTLHHFGLKQHMLLTGGKYFDTPWRNKPSHQGGFVLDAGIHSIAALRQLLPPGEKLATVCAFSRQARAYLPPLDSVDAVLRTESGASGTLSISFGSTVEADGYWVGCENGSVSVTSDKADRIAMGGKAASGMVVTVQKGEGDKESLMVEDEGTGVAFEVRVWAEAITRGSVDQRQTVEEARADLEVLEAIFRSGEQGGAPQTLQYQI